MLSHLAPRLAVGSKDSGAILSNGPKVNEIGPFVVGTGQEHRLRHIGQCRLSEAIWWKPSRGFAGPFEAAWRTSLAGHAGARGVFSGARA